MSINVFKKVINKIIMMISFLSVLICKTSYADCNTNMVLTTPNERYELLNNAQEVKDLQTKLIWQRCSLGQIWDGLHCKGEAIRYKWSDALKIAKEMSNNWRVPNIKELNSLVEEACFSPAINDRYFPNMPQDDDGVRYWSSSPSNAGGSYVMGVDFDTGDITTGLQSGTTDNYSSASQEFVRLVRSGD